MAERTVFQSISRKHVTSLGPQASVRDAACIMTRANCGSVLVMEPPDKLLGILTERDLMTRVLAKGLDPEHTTAREVMTPNPICVPPETLVSDAVVLMLERGFRHLPLVSGTKILGVFSVRDALPREIGTALSQAEFNEQVNDVLG
ncbi:MULTISPECIES: CBS domain-containing protein [Variovorax]|jgi:CBS domain-containing protein|uniref:CBS domain-containing protein n=1 Tax=Variovorax ginsengisoli TaxID=363844 RepID=A0ABT8SFN5_9BURK|nr:MULTISPECIES: CBS domain-containing protein [Variovorax]MDM0033611.1 CBS domain-containing protein [Variovorax sp. J22P271]MDM0079366.1 CBS domain-containing protein [Variovorax sp. J31P179]MDN8618559.1 CBS domain-containing protein [Variovorax ginsengisoli]MDO1537729.1 CBS domain-containing protein [Variovorax ginsengisoli]